MEEVTDNVVENVTEAAERIGISAELFQWKTVLTAVVLLIICLVVVKLLLRVLDRVLERGVIDKSLHVFIRGAVKYLLLFVTILIVAASLGVNITSLIALLSVMGLAVSLAVQGVLSNLAGGIMVLISKPFAVGDYVETGDFEGTVKQIGLIHTQIDTLDNRLVYIPNGDIAAARIVNYSSEPLRMVELKVEASYETPTETVHEALWAARSAVDAFLEEPPTFINIFAYGSSSIQYVFRGWVKNEDYWPVHFRLLEEVRRQFELHGVEMTYDHINVHMIGGDNNA